MEPKDPLTNLTLSVPESERIESSVPVAYRLCYSEELDAYKLKGAFKTYNDQGMIIHEWRDLPTVVED